MTADVGKDFLALSPPFDRLNESELARVAEDMVSAQYGAGQTIVHRWESPPNLHVVVTGTVEEADSTGPVGRLTAGQIFDSRAFIEGRSQHSFTALEPCTCYLVPARVLRQISARQPEVHRFFIEDVGRRADAVVALRQQREVASVLTARLGSGELQPALFVAPETSIHEAVSIMKERGTSALLVGSNERPGIFTSRDVRERLVLMGMPGSTPIGTIASYDLITLCTDDFVLDALAVMTKHAIRHVVVTEDEQIVGMLEQADLLRYFTNTSYAISDQAERAEDRDDLREAGAGIPPLIRSLYERGVKPRYIARLVTDLNRKIYRRLFEQLAPPPLADSACLIVMGSEGRGEQLLRTDQDNGMIFDGAAAPPGFVQVATAFPQALVELGYPPCPGHVMTSNPQWAKSIEAFREDILAWVHQPSADGFMNLAILLDAVVVAGAPALLKDLKAQLTTLVAGQQTVLRHFARAVQSFPTPLGLFSRFKVERGDHDGQFDLKKGGIFPIVHAVRSIALEHGVSETNTIARLQALSGRRPLGRELTADLIEAFDFMSMLRLRTQLEQEDQGIATDNYVRPGRLNSLERGLLRDSLKVVNQLKSLMNHHYRLDALS